MEPTTRDVANHSPFPYMSLSIDQDATHFDIIVVEAL